MKEALEREEVPGEWRSHVLSESRRKDAPCPRLHTETPGDTKLASHWQVEPWRDRYAKEWIKKQETKHGKQLWNTFEKRLNRLCYSLTTLKPICASAGELVSINAGDKPREYVLDPESTIPVEYLYLSRSSGRR